MNDQDDIPDLTDGLEPVDPAEGTAGPKEASGSSASAPPPSVPRPPPKSLIGRRLKDTYELDKKIGEGGMGHVYVATQHPLERQVAVKVLKPSETNPDGEHYFMREVKAINMLRHPNIINVIDFGKDDQTGSLFLVMEFLPGKTLKEVLKTQFPLQPTRVCEIGIQVLNALQSAHDAGIVHCDLKPANIMIERVAGQDDFIKVLDFGIAKVKESGMEVGPYTEQGNIVGTFDYMSPEQIMRKDLDGRSDVWSWGVIMYEMLTQKRLFHDDDAVSIIGRVMQMPLQPPSTHLEGVAEVLDAIVMKAMERNVDERFASADRMRRALQKASRLLEGQSTTGRVGTSTASAAGADSGSLSGSGLIREESQSLSSSGASSGSLEQSSSADPSGSGPTGASALFTRSGTFGSAGPSPLGGGVAAGTSVLDETFSAEELQGNLLGETRKVAVVAVKQRSSGGGGVDAAEVASRSRREAAAIEEVVDHFDGTIDSVLGGTFVILFGARRARVGDHVRAVECAVELQQRLRGLADGAAHIGLAVAYGDVSISKAHQANAYGAAIDRCVSIASSSAEAEIYAGESIVEATGQQVSFDLPRSVAGRDVFEVLKISRPSGQSDAQDDGFDDQDVYVQRSQLWAELSRRASEVVDNHGGGVAIVGEMGIGKSRLLDHLVDVYGDDQRDQPWQAFSVEAADAGGQQLLAVVGGWIAEIADTYDDPAGLVHKACESLGLTQNVDDVAALFMDDDVQEHTLTVPWDSQQGFAHFSSALLHKLIRFALKKGPVLLAVDDVPVGDKLTVQFLEALVSRIQRMRVMVVATRRVEASIREHGFSDNFEVAHLGGFTEGQSKQFISQLLGYTPPLNVVEQLHRQSSGSPVFLKELIQSVLRHSGPEALMDLGRLEDTHLPGGLHEALAQRVDRMDQELRDLMRLAAVLGESFPEDWFFQITPSHLHPRDNLKTLVAHHLLEARYDAHRRVVLAFNPRALRRIVYDRLPDEARVQIHARVIEFLESAPDLAAVDPVEIPLMLAFHYRSVDGLEGAAHYLRDGGNLLLDMYDYAAAIEHFQEAVCLLDQAATPADAKLRVSIQLQLLVALRESGRIDDAQRLIDELPDVEAIPAECRNDLLYEIGTTGAEAGSIDTSLAALRRLRDRAVDAGEPKTEIEAMLAIAEVLEKQNKMGQAADVLADVPQRVASLGQLDLADPDDRKLYWTAYNQLGAVFIRLKDLQKAQKYLNTALKRARHIEDHRGLVRVLSNLGALCLSMRDVERAADYFTNAFTAAEGVGDLLNQSRILTNLGITAMQANQLEDTKGYFKRARALAEDIGWYEGLAELSIHIKRLQKALG